MKHFLKNMKKYGIKYAVLMKVWQALDSLYNIKRVRRISTKLQDKVETILDKYDNHLQPQEIPVFESNCIGHWSCDCCPNKGGCNEYSY